jgi:UDP-N-acetylglucosamine--N-acetylmuramyl-(pentapeptide) pyrophosphoryl-undecaprenol N-acetylglucosamine transferase
VQKKNPKILFAAGGTGGHLFPAIAIANEVRRIEPNAEFLFVGTKGKIEKRVVPEHGFNFRAIWISGMARRFKPGNLLVPFKLLVSLMQSLALIKSFRPDVVVGTGGYVTGPVLYIATLLRLPTLIQEQNSYPGFTTRKLAPKVNEVHVAFEETKRHLSPKSNVKLSGNPTRNALGSVARQEGAAFFHLDPSKQTLLIFGGSLGAGSMNDAVLGFFRELANDGIQLIWQTGERDYEKILSSTKGTEGLRVEKFIEHMEYAYAAADVVVCRAGATTIAELTRLGKPAILVPFPHAAEGHQQLNARALVEAGAASLVSDNELVPKLKETVFALLRDDQQRAEMANRSRLLGKPNAAREIAEAVLRLAGWKV